MMDCYVCSCGLDGILLCLVLFMERRRGTTREECVMGRIVIREERLDGTWV